MALMLPHSVFFHIPKTGGTWVRQAIKNAGIPTVEIPRNPKMNRSTHATPRVVSCGGKFTFAFVRNPWDWYRSLWGYRMKTGWRTEDLFDSCRSDDFEEFMWKALQRFPGYLGYRFRDFVGPGLGLLDFVGKQENLAEDLITALKLAGEEFDETKILSTPPQSASDLRPVYSPQLFQAVLESEWKTLVRFRYLSPIRAAHPSQSLSTSTSIGTSMLPFFNSAEKVVTQPVDPITIQRGDIITFWTDSSKWVTHRVVQVIRRNGLLAFRTKGDNRIRLDPVVLSGDIVGKAIRIGKVDLTRPFWRGLGYGIASLSYAQAMLYRRLSSSHLNRIRHGLEQRNWLPKLRLQGIFRLITNPFSAWEVLQKKALAHPLQPGP